MFCYECIHRVHPDGNKSFHRCEILEKEIRVAHSAFQIETGEGWEKVKSRESRKERKHFHEGKP